MRDSDTVHIRHSLILGAFLLLLLTGCRNLTTVPQPVTEVTEASLYETQPAEQAFYSGRALLFRGMGEPQGSIEESGMLADEFTAFGDCCDAADLRSQALNGQPSDQGVQYTLGARQDLLLSIAPLAASETGSGRARIGEAYALAGYAALILAEDWCAGVPLSEVLAAGGVVFGAPLTTDSLLGTAEAHFDSALANVGTPVNDTILYLASVGLGRTRLDRGHFAAADSAVAGVPTSFVYDILAPSSYTGPGGAGQLTFYERAWATSQGLIGQAYNIGNSEGSNGLNFVSASDPRVAIDSTLVPTSDGYGDQQGYNNPVLPDSIAYTPLQYWEPNTNIPLATGIEARLIQAEVALDRSDVTGMANILNGLRNDVPDTKVTFANPLPADSTNGADSVSTMFRERAFWLFGTGTRLGDLRRLMRQHGALAQNIFPVGDYTPNDENMALYNSPAIQYGTDVSLELPLPNGGPNGSSLTAGDPNTRYVGCTGSLTTP